jgi:hypothetical protein
MIKPTSDARPYRIVILQELDHDNGQASTLGAGE